MNLLSWFLYFSDAIPALAATLWLISIAIFIVLFIVWFNRVTDAYYKKGDIKTRKYFQCVILSAAICCIASIFPSKNTMYAIAASELGQKAVDSELGGKALKAVEQWIYSQVKK